MRPSFLTKVLATIVVVGAASGVGAGSDPIPARPGRPTTAPAEKALSLDRALNYRLASDYLTWIATRYARNMKFVNGRATDVADSVEAIGFDETVERYAALRRVDLDYAREHPDQTNVPNRDLLQIGQAKYELVVANAWSSKKWIDFRAAALRKGVIGFYARGARVTLPFYRKLLATPIKPETADFRDLIRTALSREEYERLARKIGSGNADFYAALKQGVTWYAPWAPLVKRTLNAMARESKALWEATPDLIYGREDEDETGV